MPTVVYKEFEWDSKKAERNFFIHGIRFEEAATVFSKPFYYATSFVHTDNELRYVAVGMWEDMEITVVYTVRKKHKRIISARCSRDYEKEYYRDYLSKIKANC